jgi:uncharacterized membrane protein
LIFALAFFFISSIVSGLDAHLVDSGFVMEILFNEIVSPVLRLVINSVSA